MTDVPKRIYVRWGKAGDTRVTYMEDRFLPPDNGGEYILATPEALAAAPEVARALLQARADLRAKDAALVLMQVSWGEDAVRVDELAAELAQARADLASANQRARDAYLRGLLDAASHLRATIPAEPENAAQIEGQAQMLEMLASREATKAVLG